MKRERHVMSALVCGLDVHKDRTYATILNHEGNVVNQTRMNNERVLPYLSDFEVSKVGMESLNQIAPLFRQRALTAKAYDVVAAQPKKNRYVAEAKIKSDRVDSRAIAELVRLEDLPCPSSISEKRSERVKVKIKEGKIN